MFVRFDKKIPGQLVASSSPTRRMTETPAASDNLGTPWVPGNVLWGAQTALRRHFFAIGEQRMPLDLIHALAWVKWAAACVNRDLGLLDADKAQAIAQAAIKVANGEYDAEFPLSVWQTGSGTQSNINVNEVIATLACAAMVGKPHGLALVHPNDEVNLGQSSNDVFPTAMHIAVALQI
jgi:fumarate hydratase class II